MKKKNKILKTLFSCLTVGSLITVPFLSTACNEPGVMPDKGWKFTWKTLLDRETINKDWFDSTTNTWTISYGQFSDCKKSHSGDEDNEIEFDINPIIHTYDVVSIKLNGIPEDLQDDFIVSFGHINLKDEIHYKVWDAFSFNVSYEIYDSSTNCYGYVTSDTINVKPQSKYRTIDWNIVSDLRAKTTLNNQVYLLDAYGLPFPVKGNTEVIPSNWTLLYDNSFNNFDKYNSDAIWCNGGMLHKDEYANYFHQDLWVHPSRPLETCEYGDKDDTSMARYQYFFIEGIDDNVPGYHLQLGNPYRWRSWNKLFYRCYSFREKLHYYFDGYTIKTPVDHSNSGNPLDSEGKEVSTTDYTLTPADVDAMVDGY